MVTISNLRDPYYVILKADTHLHRIWVKYLLDKAILGLVLLVSTNYDNNIRR